MSMETIKGFTPGQRVTISAVNFPNHAHMVGQTGTVKRYIKCRDAYDIVLDVRQTWGNAWEAAAKNIAQAPNPAGRE